MWLAYRRGEDVFSLATLHYRHFARAIASWMTAVDANDPLPCQLLASLPREELRMLAQQTLDALSLDRGDASGDPLLAVYVVTTYPLLLSYHHLTLRWAEWYSERFDYILLPECLFMIMTCHFAEALAKAIPVADHRPLPMLQCGSILTCSEVDRTCHAQPAAMTLNEYSHIVSNLVIFASHYCVHAITLPAPLHTTFLRLVTDLILDHPLLRCATQTHPDASNRSLEYDRITLMRRFEDQYSLASRQVPNTASRLTTGIYAHLKALRVIAIS
jgi:hypothetical protein